MQKVLSLPPVSLGSPEIDWGFAHRNSRRTSEFQTSSEGIEYKDGHQATVPDELEELVDLIDEDFREFNEVEEGSPVTHYLDIRSGYANSASMLTSGILPALNLPYPRLQLAGAFHLDLVDEERTNNPISYTLSTPVSTEFLQGELYVARRAARDNFFSIFGALLGNYALLRAQSGLITQPDAGELVRFDPTSTAHRAPFRYHDGTGIDHLFLRDAVSIGPIPQKS